MSSFSREAITAALQQVIEPQSGKSVIELGLVRAVATEDRTVRVTFEMPKELLEDGPREHISTQTRDAVLPLEGVTEVAVEFAVKPPPRVTTGLPGVQRVLAVGAGKGGVGKSTVSALLAFGLKRRGLNVGLMDADVYGPSLPKITGSEHAQPMADPDSGRVFPPEIYGVKVMSMGYLMKPDQAVVWRGPMAQKYVKEFLDRGDWGELDYLIVDLPPGTGDIPLTLAQSIPLTGAVVVCTPQDVALLDATRAIRMYEKLSVETLGMVENMSFYHCPNCGHRDEIFGHGGAKQTAEAMGVPFLGEIPLNLSIRVSGDAGQPMANWDGAPEAVSQALDAFITRTVEEVDRKVKKSTPLPQLRIS